MQKMESWLFDQAFNDDAVPPDLKESFGNFTNVFTIKRHKMRTQILY